MAVATKTERAKAYNDAITRRDAADEALDALADDATEEDRTAARTEYDEAQAEVEALRAKNDDHEARERARDQHKPVEIPKDERTPEAGRERAEVTEPDLYEKGGRSFLHDLYMRDLKQSGAASERINKHHDFEVQRFYGKLGVQERAVATATLGGIIPPQYLIDLYAKAGRNGRVYADQANHQTLPDIGMSVIVPRLTVGLSAGVQATENTTVTTSDPTEVDLSVPVRTLAGYSPVSRQTLERAAYSDVILFEDLMARYFALLDTQCINGSGAAGQILGVLNTAGISTSSVATATVAAVWPKIADCIQQINSAFGGLGILADKIIMHPRRYGFFTAGLDTQNRPLMVPMAANAMTGDGVNVMAAGGLTSAYGYTGTLIQGLPVFTDANIPTNLGGGTNEDRIIVEASSVVHLWERDSDPVTLSFEQQVGTSLQVQLVAYGYAAFTAGRYPAASATVTGAGLVPPTF